MDSATNMEFGHAAKSMKFDHDATHREFDHGAKELSDMPPALVENSNETHYCESATNMDIGPYNYVLELENKEMTHLLWNHTQSMDVYLQSKDGSTLIAHKCVLASQSRFMDVSALYHSLWDILKCVIFSCGVSTEADLRGTR
jgi:hypothetical protein